MSDLNRRIATALGMKVYTVDENDPHSGPCFGQDRDWYWEYVILPNGECADVPDYANDLNAAWSLPLPDTATRYLEQRDGVSTARIGHLDWPPTIAHQHESAATALCEAWLQWKAGQGDTEAAR